MFKYLKCGWFSHDWGNWEDVRSGLTRRHPEDGGGISGSFVEQRRRCKKCNKVKMRNVTTR